MPSLTSRPIRFDGGLIACQRPPGEWRSVEAVEGAAAFYYVLTGVTPTAARIDSDGEFDAHVFACLVAVAWTEAQGADVARRLGLSPREFGELVARYFPQAAPLLLDRAGGLSGAPDDEVEMVRELLSTHRSRGGKEGTWLAAMIARRAVEPNHLWEDLGLRDRGELGRLLTRHFGSLAVRNTRNMRWKRFFYRVMCESDGFVMCATPVCSACGDFERCFGEETGESRLARARRDGAAPVAPAA